MPAKTLFSEHYLETRLPSLPEWNEDPSRVFAEMRKLWETARPFRQSWNEAQTEDEFVKKTFDALGWSYVVQARARSGGRATRPDYALFGDEGAKFEAYPHQGSDDAFYARVLAVGEAKYWGRSLSQKESSGRETWKTDNNPSHQMVSYLVGTRVAWGILTNGQVWRLYSREVSSTASEYYEVDLAQVFDIPEDNATLDRFKRFWLFFRRAAFVADARGQSFVQRVHEGSATYAREISDKLKDLVFKEVMPEIAGGFLAYRWHEKDIRVETDASLREVYEASLSLLYKLLFLLYAEARGLLPVDNPSYSEQSITTLAQWAAVRIDERRVLSKETFATPRYDALLALFARVDRGAPSLGIPRYNGGLFSPDHPDNQFLAEHKLSDAAVARAVDLLVRDAGEPVDYAYISVRNLGAIYEGLLENRLRVVNAAAGQVELVNDKGDRKATGSYYTPDYIVDYIVRHTLDPILAERDALFRQAMDRCATLRKRLARVATHGKAEVLRAELADAEHDAREAFLGIKVLDPAMGSGHFLVNAVDHLTDGIIDRMEAYHNEHPLVLVDWNPIQQLIERVRADILTEMGNQHINIDRTRLDDTSILTRLVMKRCIYGVDLNPMAVELAKLSLWLHSFTIGAPLSFLDHHLRWGNSLIGTNVHTVEETLQRRKTGLLSLLASPFARLLDLTQSMIEVADQSDATLADVRHSADVFKQFQADLTPYKQILDLWVSQYFGNKTAEDFLSLYGADVLPALRGERQVGSDHHAAIERARQLWRNKRFFHWDLEFPEVFIDLRRRDWASQPGFDAVIGNPPWLGLRTGVLEADLLDWMRHRFASATGQFDLAAVFLEQGLGLMPPRGGIGFVLPKRIATNESYEKLRHLLVVERGLTSAIDLGVAFKEVDSDAMILVAGTSAFSDTATLGTWAAGPSPDVQPVERNLINDMPFLIIPINSTPEAVRLVGTIVQRSTRKLGEIVKITRGMECGMNHPAITHAPKPTSLPLVDHLDVNRHHVSHSGWYVNVEDVKPSVLKASEIYTSVPKLLVRFLSPTIIAGRDTTGYASTNLVYHIHSGNQTDYLCGILCSRLISFWYRTAFQNEEVKFPHVQKSHLDRLPLPRPTRVTPPDERTTLVEQGQKRYQDYLSGGPLHELLAFLDEQIAHNPERTDVVHDLLAFLANEMISLHQARQTEIDGFLAWLESQIGAPIASLANKTDFLNYLGDYQKGEETLPLEGLRERLRKNKSRLKIDLTDRDFQAALKREYERSLGVLLPLKAKLKATDRLIDLIVYRLYDLTDDEIALIEAATL